MRIMLIFMLFAYLNAYDFELIYLNSEPKQEVIEQEEDAQDLEFQKEYKYRKYSHVRDFYKSISDIAVEIGLAYDIPPASILAIAGVESGYGSGYVGKITGNILSLGAKSSEPELPSLYLPHVNKTKQVLINPKKIANFDEVELTWKKRPKSLKKDYRPKNIAGTPQELDYFIKNKNAYLEAKKACMIDFASDWISKDSNIPAFKEARIWLESIVAKEGKEILFTQEISEQFIDKIGGKKLSFNYRKSWPIKVKTLMSQAGLVELVNNINSGKNFAQSW